MIPAANNDGTEKGAPMKNHLPLSPNTADSSEWPKMWWDAVLVAPDTFDKGRVCNHVTTTYEGGTTHTLGTATTAPDCTTILSIYNDGPLCHSHNRKAPVDEMNGATI